jgi:hypothetical protein
VTTHSDEAAQDPLWVPIPGNVGASMRVVRRGGRWVVTAVYVHDDEITASALQKIRLGDQVQEANLSWDLSSSGSVLKFGGRHVHPETDGAEPSLKELRELENKQRRQPRPAGPSRSRKPLSRPDGTDPDGFYREVAEAYREYAPRTRAPGSEIAREAGVPVGTARSWIREARRRGFLPPGRRGAAG